MIDYKLRHASDFKNIVNTKDNIELSSYVVIDSVPIEFAKTHVPMKRYGAEGELNAGVIFLASDEASYVTGVILPIDGGYTCV